MGNKKARQSGTGGVVRMGAHKANDGFVSVPVIIRVREPSSRLNETIVPSGLMSLDKELELAQVSHSHLDRCLPLQSLAVPRASSRLGRINGRDLVTFRGGNCRKLGVKKSALPFASAVPKNCS